MEESKKLNELEDIIFQTMEGMYQAFDYGQKEKYKLALASLEFLNEEYKELTGNHFIKDEQMTKHYAKMWEF